MFSEQLHQKVTAHWVYQIVVTNDYEIQRDKETLRIWPPALRAGGQIAITLRSFYHVQ